MSHYDKRLRETKPNWSHYACCSTHFLSCLLNQLFPPITIN